VADVVKDDTSIHIDAGRTDGEHNVIGVREYVEERSREAGHIKRRHIARELECRGHGKAKRRAGC
jgi:hypothetical protein